MLCSIISTLHTVLFLFKLVLIYTSLLLVVADQIGGAKAKKTRAELYKQIKANYYGFRDEDDRELLILEEAAEKAGTRFHLSYQSYDKLSICTLLALILIIKHPYSSNCSSSGGVEAAAP